MLTSSVCKKCFLTKELTEFRKDKNRKSGHFPRCKQCEKEYYLETREQQLATRRKNYQKNKEAYIERSYEWRQENKEKRALSERQRVLKKKYGLSLEQFDSMYQEQRGLCGICFNTFESSGREAHVDHCHSTGKIRGLLCYNCNLLLGHAKDNLHTLANAIKYLKE